MEGKWFILCILCFLKFVLQVVASTHWVVTENGKIQAQLDSVFSLRHPYDLVALMQQEKRAILVEELKQQLMAHKEEIDRNEDKEANLEEKLYITDVDCVAAGKPLTEFDLYLSTVIPLDLEDLDAEDVLDVTPWGDYVDSTIEVKDPNCSEIIDLDFSMHAFEHLRGMRERANLTMTAEEGLLSEAIEDEYEYRLDSLGHIIYRAMKRNRTSWKFYNLAAYYWREQGDAKNAIECVRRALHFSNRDYKDVALLSLGNILHRANFSEEAAIVVHAAVDHAPETSVCHFTLGNIYAVLSDYNRSAICFENTLKLEISNPKIVEQRLKAVCCLNKLEKALEAQHTSLQRTLTELQEHQQQHEYWLRQQERLMSVQAPMEVKLEQQLQYEDYRIRQSLDGRGGSFEWKIFFHSEIGKRNDQSLCCVH